MPELRDHPAPSRILLRAMRADPPPPGEGKKIRSPCEFDSIFKRPIIVIARSEATKQSILSHGEMDCFASLAMTVSVASLLAMTASNCKIRLCILAAQCARVVGEAVALKESRAWGMPGVDAPAASRATKKAHERSHHRSTGICPAFPHAMVLRLISRSPR